MYIVGGQIFRPKVTLNYEIFTQREIGLVNLQAM
jgi:hypothetical protein